MRNAARFWRACQEASILDNVLIRVADVLRFDVNVPLRRSLAPNALILARLCISLQSCNLFVARQLAIALFGHLLARLCQGGAPQLQAAWQTPLCTSHHELFLILL